MDDYRMNTADNKGAADIPAGFSDAEKTSKSGTSGQTRKIKIRQAMQDKGVFQTGVEVVEHEIELDEDAEGHV
jgi:hypothetical protein